MPYKYRDHAWISTWGQKDGKSYVVVCMLEHGGHGGESAGPVVKAVYDYLFGPAPAAAKSAAKAQPAQEIGD